MPYWRLYYHLIWTTKNRHPLIASAWEADLYGYLWGKAAAMGCLPHAIGGVADHVHVVISIPPRLAVAQVVGRLKGASAHHVNHVLAERKSFQWQAGYGALTFGERALPRVVRYVQRQKVHHAAHTLWPFLEQAPEAAPDDAVPAPGGPMPSSDGLEPGVRPG